MIFLKVKVSPETKIEPHVYTFLLKKKADQLTLKRLYILPTERNPMTTIFLDFGGAMVNVDKFFLTVLLWKISSRRQPFTPTFCAQPSSKSYLTGVAANSTPECNADQLSRLLGSGYYQPTWKRLWKNEIIAWNTSWVIYIGYFCDRTTFCYYQ